MKYRNSWIMFAVAFILAATVSFGQTTHTGGAPGDAVSPESLKAPDTYGSGQISLILQSLQFVPLYSGGTYNSDLNGNRYADTALDASVTLPSGASITGLELQGCDSDAATSITVNLFSKDPSTLLGLGSVNTGPASAIPGCSYFGTSITPVTVDNYFKSYFVEVFGTSANAKFSGVRIYYHLQVSPGPGTNTFADVPTTSGQFKFVEALYAAGITGGCGGGNFCPNQYVTRGQMAVFLASALGLHWPN